MWRMVVGEEKTGTDVSLYPSTLARDLFNLFDTKSKGYIDLEELDDLLEDGSDVVQDFDASQLRMVFSILAQGTGQVTEDAFTFAFQNLLRTSEDVDEREEYENEDDQFMDDSNRDQGGTRKTSISDLPFNDEGVHLQCPMTCNCENETDDNISDTHSEDTQEHVAHLPIWQQQDSLTVSDDQRTETSDWDHREDVVTSGEDVYEGCGLLDVTSRGPLYVSNEYIVDTDAIENDEVFANSHCDRITGDLTIVGEDQEMSSSHEGCNGTRGGVQTSFPDLSRASANSPPGSHVVRSHSEQQMTENNITTDSFRTNNTTPEQSKDGDFWNNHHCEKIKRRSAKHSEHKLNSTHGRPRSLVRSATQSFSKPPPLKSGRRRQSFHSADVTRNSRETESSEDSDVKRKMSRSQEDWDAALKRLGGVPVLGSNPHLRFMWQQLSLYHADLVQPFEDFLRFVIEEIQKAYAKCQELENTLLSKGDLHEKEIATMYEEMDQILQKERDLLQDKHFEREENQKNDFNRALELRESDLQEALSYRAELESRVESLVHDISEVKCSRDRIEKQLNEANTVEYHLRIENESIRQEYETALSRLDTSSKTIRDLQNQVIQVAKIAEVDRQNYKRCLRHYQDMMEEKEYLDMNINNMSQELAEMKTLNKSLLERMESVNLGTSILWERQHAEISPPPSPSSMERDEVVFEDLNEVTLTSTPVKRTKFKLNAPKSGFKVIFVGDAAVGKSSLIKRMCRGSFDSRRVVTPGPDCFHKTVTVDDQDVLLKLWDTVGQERFNSLPPSYFRNSDVVVLMYDMAEEISFLNAKSWMKTIHEYTDENVTLVLVGNKLDLDHRRKVKMDKAVKLSKENDAIFLETSAKTNENVQQLCSLIASAILDKEDTVLIRETCVQVLEKEQTNILRKRPCCQT